MLQTLRLIGAHGWYTALEWIARGEWLDTNSARAACLVAGIEASREGALPPAPVYTSDHAGVLEKAAIPALLPANLADRVRRAWSGRRDFLAWVRSRIAVCPAAASPGRPRTVHYARSCEFAASAGQLVASRVTVRGFRGSSPRTFTAFRYPVAEGAAAYVFESWDPPEWARDFPVDAADPLAELLHDRRADLRVAFLADGLDVLHVEFWADANLPLDFMSMDGTGRYAVTFSSTGRYEVPLASFPDFRGADAFCAIMEAEANRPRGFTLRRGPRFLTLTRSLFAPTGTPATQASATDLLDCIFLYLALQRAGVPMGDVEVHAPRTQRIIEVTTDRCIGDWRARGHRAALAGPPRPSDSLVDRSWIECARADLGMPDVPNSNRRMDRLDPRVPPTNSASDPLNAETVRRGVCAYLVAGFPEVFDGPSVQLARSTLAFYGRNGISVRALNKYNKTALP